MRTYLPLVAFAMACDQGPRPPNPDEIPEMVTVAGSEMTEGYALGIQRRTVTVDAFRISRMPITVGRWKQCVSVGACAPPESRAPSCTDATRTFEAANADAPVTCVAWQQAVQYCSWQHGARMPTPAEWLLAARGSRVQRYPWGNAIPNCDQHPLGVAGKDPVRLCRDPDAAARDAWVVGKHPLGTGESGMTDVLLVPGELLTRTKDAQFPGCFGSGACLVRGSAPGAIDGVVSLPKETPTPEVPVYGFRCVWTGGVP